jgi:hypothetical protein
VTYVVHPDRYSRTGVSVRKNRVVIHTAESSEGSRVEDVLINFMGAAGNLTVPGSNPPRVFGAAYTAIPDSAKGTYREAYDAARLGVYAQGGANKDSWSFCIPGRASQTRAEWLDGYSRECIRIAARYTVDKCRQDDIPLERKSWQQIAAGERGYCDHYTISLAFKKSDHTDVGPNFPWDVFAADIDAIVNPPTPELGRHKEVGRPRLGASVPRPPRARRQTHDNDSDHRPCRVPCVRPDLRPRPHGRGRVRGSGLSMVGFGLDLAAERVISIVAFLAAVAALAHYGRRFILWVRTFVRFVDNAQEVWTLVEHEFKPNHGTSMRDAIDRIEGGQVELIVRLDEHDKRFDALEELVTSPPPKKKVST